MEVSLGMAGPLVFAHARVRGKSSSRRLCFSITPAGSLFSNRAAHIIPLAMAEIPESISGSANAVAGLAGDDRATSRCAAHDFRWLFPSQQRPHGNLQQS